MSVTLMESPVPIFRSFFKKRSVQSRRLILESLEDRRLLSANTPAADAVAPSGPTGAAAKIREQIVITTEPITAGELSELPASIETVEAGTTIYVSIWVKNTDGSANGISSTYCDLKYTTDRVTAGTYTPSPVFSQLVMASSSADGTVSFVGGSASLGTFYGVDSWAQTGTYSFTADQGATATFWNWTPTIDGREQPSAGTARRGDGVIYTDEIDFSSVSISITGGGLEPITDVNLTGWSGVYDGAPHTVTLSDPYAATDTIRYTYNGVTYTAPPSFTEVGTYTVGASVSRAGYSDWTGSATVVIGRAPITDVSLAGWSGVYDGAPHTVTLSDPYAATDTIRYTYNGVTYTAPPSFTEVGTYTVGASVSRAGYSDWTGSATVVIAESRFADLTVTGMTMRNKYDPSKEMSGYTADPEDSLQLVFTVANQGEADVRLPFYNSTAVYDASGRLVFRRTSSSAAPYESLIYGGYYDDGSPALAAGETAVQTITIGKMAAGTYTVVYSVDNRGKVAESDKTNNLRSWQFTVEDPQYALAASNLVLTEKDSDEELVEIETTEAIAAHWNLSNTGEREFTAGKSAITSAVTLARRAADGTYSDLIYDDCRFSRTEGLSVGGTARTGMTLGRLAAGEYRLTVTVDPRGDYDADLSDNTLVRYFTVSAPAPKPAELHVGELSVYTAESAYISGYPILKGTLTFTNTGAYATGLSSPHIYTRVTLYDMTRGVTVRTHNGFEYCYLGSLAAGESGTNVITFGALPVGEYRLDVLVDSHERVTQTTRLYNEKSFTFTVPLSAAAFFFDPLAGTSPDVFDDFDFLETL
ncbi:MAG: hypothetical protein IJJ20_01075 [Thermoguttaceae bacterium]|nr:hypothetical protein [Thermoguttaceae bacterium]